MRSRMLRWLIVIGALVALPGSTFAQEATVSGTVTDTTGGVLPGVTITAVHEASGNTFTSVTDERGTYRIPVRTGVYRLTVELPGFSTVNRTGLELLVGQQAVVNIQMEPSARQETVTVTAEAPLIDTTSSVLSSNIDTRQLSELPLNGRNWVDLTMLAPGSRANAIAETPTTRNTNNSGSFQLNVDGQQVTQTLAFDFGQPRFSRDAIAEFQFVASRFDATQGRSMGVQVNAISKSGTNTFAGSLSGYFRDDGFNAADFIQNRVLPYQDTQASATFGGPLRRDRIHFFAHYEYEREPQTFTYNSVFPRFNLDHTGIRREQKGGLKLDMQFSPQTRMAVRASTYENEIPFEPATAGGAIRHPSSPERRDRHSDELNIQFWRVLSNRALNEFRVGYAGFGWFRTGIVRTPDFIVTPKGPAGASPRINFSGYQIGPSNTNLPAVIDPESYSLRDDFTYSFNKGGRHDLKLGGEYLYAPIRVFIAFNGFGVLDAQGGPIPANLQDLFPVWNDVSTWNLTALTPISRRYSRSVGNFNTRTPRHVSAYWFQDDWATTDRLTLNLGVRYDLQVGALAESETLAPFLTAPRPSDTNNVAPRLGFAYTLTDRTVVRGGYGRFYGEVTDNLAAFTRSRLAQIDVTVERDGRPDFASNPFNGPLPTFEQVLNTLCTVSSGPRCVRRSIATLPAPDIQIPYSHQASIGVQRQVRNALAVAADYVFTGSRHEIRSENINLGYNPATGVNYRFSDISRRPYPDWGSVSMTFSNGWSNTHSLQMAVTKRLSQRWQGTATYTLSGLWDGTPQPSSGLSVVPFALVEDLGRQYTLAASDQRHRAVFNGIWEGGYGFQLSGLYFFGSGERFATTYGGDPRDGGGSRVRPDGSSVKRNNFVGRPLHRVDLRVQQRVPLGGRVRMDGILEVFNAFNHENYGSYVTLEQIAARYGQPTQNINVAYAPRMLQLGFRLTF